MDGWCAARRRVDVPSRPEIGGWSAVDHQVHCGRRTLHVSRLLELSTGRCRAESARASLPASMTLRESADVLVAIAEDNLVTEVRRGENGGTTPKATPRASRPTPRGRPFPREQHSVYERS